MTDLVSHSQDLDIQDAIEEAFPSETECTEATHQFTAWDREMSQWLVRFTIPTSFDVGAVTSRINSIPHMQCEREHSPEGGVTVHPDGHISLMIETGPGVEEE